MKIKTIKIYRVDPDDIPGLLNSIPKKPINERKAKRLAKDVGKIIDRYYADENCVTR